MKMQRVSVFSLLILFLGFSLAACSGGSGGGGGGDGVEEPPIGIPTITPTPTPTPPTEAPPVIGDAPGLCVPGDVGLLQFDETGKARFSLTPDSIDCTKNSRKEEYTLIMFNTLGTSQSFSIQGPIDATIEEDPAARIALNRLLPKPVSSRKVDIGIDRMSTSASEIFQEAKSKKKPLRYTGQSPIYQTTTQDFKEGDEAEFRIRCDKADPDVFCVTSARLRSQGTFINIFTDRDMPFEATDGACSTNQRADDCLSKTQLDRIASIFDQNTYLLATELMGSESDVDGDTRVNVVISPIVNKYLDAESYTDPRSLLPFNGTSNPGSNESEVIFVFAPDSLGNYRGSPEGNQFGVPAVQFVSKSLNAWIAFQFSKIINFNQHVFLNGGLPEDDWIADGIGTLIADLAGFNIWRPAAWLYLARPQLDDLRGSEDLDDRDFEGNEYLFLTYFMQAVLDKTVTDSDSDGFDDDLDFLNTLVATDLTGVENLENAVDYDFDEDTETEFQAIFKDWTLAIATSGTNRQDLQQNNDALNYYLGLNGRPVGGGSPSRFGTGITNNTGSTRVGADGGSLDFDDLGIANAVRNIIGIDLNLYHDEDGVLIENADEHVWAPGNKLEGYIDPFTAMHVRLGGMFQKNQVLTVRASSSALQGYLLRRTDIKYPRVYSESRFSSLDQYAENLDEGNENPYWVNKGEVKRIDIASHIAQTADDELAPDFLSIVGRIDEPSGHYICPSNVLNFLTDCTATDIPDVDKYYFTLPDTGLGTTAANGFHDEGFLAISVRRQFDEGSDGSDLTPMLAIVSSKDVPYPYARHPFRGSAAHDTRQQYRWLATSFPCGDDDDGEVTTDLNNCSATPADPGVGEATEKIFLAEERDPFEPNLGPIAGQGAASTGLFDDLGIDGDITGEECDSASNLAGASAVGYGASGAFAVTNVENSPSSLGAYPWSQTFMTLDWGNTYFPDTLFDREVLKPVSGFPPELLSEEVSWDPRGVAVPTLNCQVQTSGDPDESNDSPDDLVSPNELYRPANLAEQVLSEMARARATPTGEEIDFTGSPDPQTFAQGVTGTLPDELQDYDILGIDTDSRDEDSDCEVVNIGNNIHASTVRGNEGAILWGNYSMSAPQISIQIDNSKAAGDSQNLYFPHPDVGGFNPFVFAAGNEIILTPGKSYTLIVAGAGDTKGRYELRMRKVSRSKIGMNFVIEPGEDEICFFEGP